MGITYEKCEREIREMIRELIEANHPDLRDAEVTVGCLMACKRESDGTLLPESAVKLHGYECAAVVRVTPLKQRAHGVADSEIVIDGNSWGDRPLLEQHAILDHELEHIQVLKFSQRKGGEIKTDDLGRPRLKLRLHDWEMGGFASIAKRHGSHALEVQAARSFQDKHGQYVFEFAASHAA